MGSENGSRAGRQPKINLHLQTRSFTYLIDESGSKGSGGRFFVVAAVRTDHPDKLSRRIEQLRHEKNFRKPEFKFGEVARVNLSTYKSLVEILAESRTKVGAFIVDKDIHDPLGDKPTWEGHLWTTATLLKGMLTRHELATILVDGISTPKDVAYGYELQNKINRTFGVKRVVSAASLDSRTCNGLQLADLVASAIAHQRTYLKRGTMEDYRLDRSPKADLANYCARALGVNDFEDTKLDHLKIHTIREQVVA